MSDERQLPEVEWEPIEPFRSLLHFQSFVAWIDVQLRDGRAVELPIGEPRYFPNIPERWLRQRDDGQVWRLVEPVAPFAGLFEPLPEPPR